MSPRLFLIPLLLSSAACSSQAEFAKKAGVKKNPAEGSAIRAVATASSTGMASSFSSSDKQGQWERTFEYKWPAAVAAQKDLAEILTAERDRLLAAEKADWSKDIKQAPSDCPGCGNRSYAMEWKVVAETPEFLSLSGDFSTYTGGAHGNHGMRSLVWDKARKAAFDGVEMFRSPAALNGALGQQLCSALNRERVRKGMEPITDPNSIFPPCPTLDDATILIGSSDRQKFDRIGIYYGPYVAGSYAEGAYELDFPVDPQVLASVKPQYRAAFAAAK